MRQASVVRNTTETRIKASVDLDGTGEYDVATGIGFLDHMIEQVSRHSLIDITLKAEGDLHIDFHHTTEDSAIVLGQALAEALGERKGIRRFGSALFFDASRFLRPPLFFAATLLLNSPGFLGFRFLGLRSESREPRRRLLNAPHGRTGVLALRGLGDAQLPADRVESCRVRVRELALELRQKCLDLHALLYGIVDAHLTSR